MTEDGAAALRAEEEALRLAATEAAATAERGQMSGPAAPVLDAFHVRAASAGAAPELPPALLADAAGDPRLEARFTLSPGALTLDLQALGAPCVRRYAGRAARLLTTDLAVDYAFAFDRAGRARLLLSPDAETAASLAAGFTVETAPAADDR